MVRRWLVHPDFEVQSPGGVVAAVSLDAMIGGLAEAATVLHRAGGHLSVVQERVPGILPGEMLTTAAVVEWRDRTDAKVQREERGPAITPELEDVPLGAPEEEFAALPAEPEAVPQPRAQRLEEEEADESSIPLAMRG